MDPAQCNYSFRDASSLSETYVTLVMLMICYVNHVLIVDLVVVTVVSCCRYVS